MPRKKRPLDRDSGVLRDAKLIVIASEDKYAVQSYFRRFRTKKVQFVVLPTENGHSSPEDVMARLNKYYSSEATEEGDEFWICIDTDHWVKSNHIQNLKLVLQQCRQKEYNVAISHPCIELWLLLHFLELAPTANGTPHDCDEVERQLRVAAGGYQKRNCDRLQISVNLVLDAIVRAKNLDQNVDDLPQTPTTRVYKIVESLQQRDSIDLNG